MADRDVAIVTPSYGPDLDRCRLLCDTIDARVPDFAKHYILVADHDERRFAEFAGPRREVVLESDILPERFLCARVPKGGRAWFSSFAWPLRGWHLQQLRRISIAAHVDHAGLLYCDSDMAFVRNFELASLWHGDRFRLYRKTGGIHSGLPEGGRKHMGWTEHAAALLGLATPSFPAADYINNLVSWRREEVLAMNRRIEAVTGRPWLRAITARRGFSECQIYGAYADHGSARASHWTDPLALCRTFWDGAPMGEAALAAYVEGLKPGQVAVGVQSFTGTDPAVLRRVLRL